MSIVAIVTSGALQPPIHRKRSRTSKAPPPGDAEGHVRSVLSFARGTILSPLGRHPSWGSTDVSGACVRSQRLKRNSPIRALSRYSHHSSENCVTNHTALSLTYFRRISYFYGAHKNRRQLIRFCRRTQDETAQLGTIKRRDYPQDRAQTEPLRRFVAIVAIYMRPGRSRADQRKSACPSRKPIKYSHFQPELDKIRSRHLTNGGAALCRDRLNHARIRSFPNLAPNLRVPIVKCN